MNGRHYEIRFSQQALDTLAGLPGRYAAQITRKIERLQFGLAGDVKALHNAEHGFRLRMGDYRVLFDVIGDQIVIQKIGNRREIYD